MKKTKRFLSMALTILLLVTLVVPALSFAAPKDDKKAGPPAFVYDKLKDKFDFIDGKKIKFNNMNVKFDVPPVVKGGRTLIPVRAVEAMGAEVKWDADNKIVTITKTVDPDNIIKIIMNLITRDVKVYINGVLSDDDAHKLDVKPGMINNRTYVPLRFIAEVLGLKVDYDNGNINLQEQPRISPTSLTFKTEIATDAAVNVTLHGYKLNSIEGLTPKTTLASIPGDYYYDVDADKPKVYLDMDYLNKIKTATQELTFIFKKAGAADVPKVLKLEFEYNMPVVEANERKFVGDDDVFIFNYDEKAYDFDSLWVKKDNVLTLVSANYTSNSNEIFLESDYFTNSTKLNVADGDTVTFIFKFKMTGEEPVTVEVKVPVDL